MLLSLDIIIPTDLSAMNDNGLILSLACGERLDNG